MSNLTCLTPLGDLDDIVLGRFGDLNTSYSTSQMNFKPTWGVSTLRYDTTLTGAGAAVGETNGEFRLQSGTANNSLALIQTNQRGQYQAGAVGRAGIGVRIPTDPTGTTYCEWGYTDFTNGFYFGKDATSAYVAYVTGGSVTKIYQADWNIDKLNGLGASGLTLTPADGLITQIDFTWYGYGDIAFCVFIQPAPGEAIRRYIVHRLKITGSASIIDPNQPLAFRVGNGASSTTNFSMYIGGHQFSVIDGHNEPQNRTTAELCTNYATALSTAWQPIIAVRKKATLSSRPNSVVVRVDHYTVCSDDQMETRLTVNGTTSNGAWASLTGWTAAETALESKVTGGTVLAASADGEPFAYDFSSSTKTSGVSVTHKSAMVLGIDTEVILWVRRLSATGVKNVLHASIEFTEEW